MKVLMSTWGAEEEMERESDPFARLFFAQAGRLVRLAGFLGAADPEDVVQEAFCKVFAGRERTRARSNARPTSPPAMTAPSCRSSPPTHDLRGSRRMRRGAT